MHKMIFTGQKGSGEVDASSWKNHCVEKERNFYASELFRESAEVLFSSLDTFVRFLGKKLLTILRISINLMHQLYVGFSKLSLWQIKWKS